MSFSIMRFNSNSFQFLHKETINIGQGTFYLKARFSSKINHPKPPTVIKLKIHIFTDNRWRKAQNLKTCTQKIEKANDFLLLPISPNSDWSFPLELSLNQTKRPFIWYFFLTDCEKILPQFTDNKNHLELELQILSPNGSHLSYDNEGAIPLNFFVSLGYILMIYAIIKKQNILKILFNEKEGMLFQNPVMFILFSMIFEVLALIFDNINLIKLSYDGIEMFFCNFLALIFGVVSQFMIISLFIFLGSGLSLTKKKIDDWELFIPLFTIVLLLEIILLAVDKAYLNNNLALHDYEGLAMGLILGIRTFFWVNLLVLLGKLWMEIRDNGRNLPLEKFVGYLAVMGSFYILGLPVVVLITNLWIPDYFKQRFAGLCNLSVQFIFMTGILLMLSDRNSLYNRVKIKKKSLQNLPVTVKKNE